MNRKVFLLGGLAILAVVFNHAAGFGQIAMFLWTDRYRPVPVPNFDQLGSLSYYVLLVVRQTTLFAVPAFLFVSGFFMAYAARAARPNQLWRIVRMRMGNLLVPYTIWSLVCFIGEALQGNIFTPLEYLRRFAIGKAESGGSYFFIPLLCQFYLLSPLIVSLARTRWRSLLLVSALVQFGTIGVRYLILFGVDAPAVSLLSGVVRHYLFFMWAFYFPLGAVCGFRIEPFKRWLARLKWWVLGVVCVLVVLGTLEPEAIYRFTGEEWRFTPLTITTSLYSIAVVLGFLAFDRVPASLSRVFYQLSGKSYGIYLLHLKVIEFVSRVIRQVAPWILAYQVVLLQPIVLAFGLGVPLLFMTVISRTQARRVYPYLFG